MSDYHVLEISQQGTTERIQVVFHIAIPDLTNEIGVSYRNALAANVDTDNPTMVPWLQTDFATEYGNILTGAVYEPPIETIKAVATETVAQKRDRIDARFTALEAQILSDFQQKYAFWGFDRDVPA